MYKASEFLELYTKLEKWAVINYGDEAVKDIEKFHHDRRIQRDARYFRNVRNILVHNPNDSDNKLIELTDELKVRFENFCNKLMNSVSQISIPYKDIYKREMSDKVMSTISFMKEKAYSYVPVMNGKKVWGVFCESTIFNIISEGDISLLKEDLQLFNIGKYITAYSEDGIYDFASVNDSIDDIRRIFSDAIDNGRRLDVIYLTSNGEKNGDLVGLVTIWDISLI